MLLLLKLLYVFSTMSQWEVHIFSLELAPSGPPDFAEPNLGTQKSNLPRQLILLHIHASDLAH